MLRPACETCVYWLPSAGDGRPQPLFGQCRRQPPTLVLTPEGARARWPSTSRLDWCGEHATIERQEAQHG
jgi:hypothetical protein